MRIVVQRVKSAKVIRVNDKQIVGQINNGLFILVGVKKGDTDRDVIYLSDKLAKLRVMSDAEDKMNLSVKDAKASFLIVSQFTLHADTSGGNRPSFINAEEPQKAKNLYELLVSSLRQKEFKVETGSFGDYMQIETILDGPVTIIFDTSTNV